MPRPKKIKQLSEPRTACPFSGKEIQYVKTAAGWQVRGPGWVSTVFYQTSDQAKWDFSFSGGVEPSYPNPIGQVTVVGEVEPSQPSAVGSAQDAEKFARNLGEDFEREVRKK